MVAGNLPFVCDQVYTEDGRYPHKIYGSDDAHHEGSP